MCVETKLSIVLCKSLYSLPDHFNAVSLFILFNTSFLSDGDVQMCGWVKDCPKEKKTLNINMYTRFFIGNNYSGSTLVYSYSDVNGYCFGALIIKYNTYVPDFRTNWTYPLSFFGSP